MLMNKTLSMLLPHSDLIKMNTLKLEEQLPTSGSGTICGAHEGSITPYIVMVFSLAVVRSCVFALLVSLLLLLLFVMLY